jgi:hypothetical protein
MRVANLAGMPESLAASEEQSQSLVAKALDHAAKIYGLVGDMSSLALQLTVR